MRRFAIILCAILLALPVLAEEKADVKVFDQAWEMVRDRFYDDDLHGVDWEGIHEDYLPLAKEAKTPEELHSVINMMLAELAASHLVLMEKEAYDVHMAPEFTGKKTLRAGFEAMEMEDGFFVGGVLEKGPAEKAGLRLGDRIVEIDGDAPEDCGLLVDAGGDPGIPGHPHYFIHAEEGETIEVTVQREEDGSEKTYSVTPAPCSMVQASRDSIRVIEKDGVKLGYIHLWHYLSPSISSALSGAIRKEFKDCDGLVLDVRGRGGNVMVIYQVLGTIKRRWKKPVTCLIDENSRSAKEIFAFQWRKDKLGPLVGRRTAGAVLGCVFEKLKDGSVLLIPVTDVGNLSPGVKLEGKGVAPDIEVPGDYRYCGGEDPVIEKGVETLLEMINGSWLGWAGVLRPAA